MRPPTPSESSRHSSPASRPQAISSAPPSPYLERAQFLTGSDRVKRPRGMSRSSTFSVPTTSTSGLLAKSTVASAVTSEEFAPLGAFVPARSASSSLRCMTSLSPPVSEHRGRLPFKWFKPKASSSLERSSSPTSLVPSFSRTSSPDSVLTAATSVASVSSGSGPIHLKVPEKQQKRRDSVLQVVEDTSPLNISCACAACGKEGANFPRCPRCLETWCSRDCRMKSSSSKKHTCRRATLV
ncbi:hypothetical protein NEOLEDRAFT_966162 [Neolentinus lepideus HHB14362 ss-1]|uniref:Uncharacterized protein n=1 Tax=Neolentinus lepideus HHB14362 ss-1 TaxID=1314782 RepID=A0A165NC65_9AGAM|nr:hypothetical protein NEOLEDRAFT_966162 [Neolentinus lepideus HHB14362 ss-1]